VIERLIVLRRKIGDGYPSSVLGHINMSGWLGERIPSRANRISPRVGDQ